MQKNMFGEAIVVSALLIGGCDGTLISSSCRDAPDPVFGDLRLICVDPDEEKIAIRCTYSPDKVAGKEGTMYEVYDCKAPPKAGTVCTSEYDYPFTAVTGMARWDRAPKTEGMSRSGSRCVYKYVAEF